MINVMRFDFGQLYMNYIQFFHLLQVIEQEMCSFLLLDVLQ